MSEGCCPFCMVPIRPTPIEAEVAEWAFGLADLDAPGCARGGVLYRLLCPTCATPLIAGPGQRWAEVDPARVMWHRDANAYMMFGDQPPT